MSISVRDNTEQDRFEAVGDSGDVAGFVTYRRRPDDIELLHAEVDSQFEGEGVASSMVHDVLDTLRDQGARVVPSCPFVRSYIDKHPEYADLVASR